MGDFDRKYEHDISGGIYMGFLLLHCCEARAVLCKQAKDNT